ncbi:hypothetical protein HGP28_14325 [Vibrio sp. SM6]|uniref:Cellobiose phosphorylase n=1 Tax=Vibrio agarilyticus TaxID=2726741 RepID=A0A7X8TSD4_9VIBR|nr:hypothetical protein [Vibrio agarilyticus]NLS14067.1 hypothetical protein [Vibrio agarilyticus]
MNYQDSAQVSGQFVDLKGERYYKISHVDQMAPFFISVVSASNHWMFISSTGALSAGRIRPENALFPYRSVDHIHENADNTGAKALFKVRLNDGAIAKWEPFNPHHDGLYHVERHLYKNAVGDKIVFEERNHSLGLTYQYSWRTSDRFGFVRETEIVNDGDVAVNIELLDGIQNLLPSGAPLAALQTKSALVDAYKWNERVAELPMATFSLYAKLSDRADPAEALRATSVFSVADDEQTLLLSSRALAQFRKDLPLDEQPLIRGERGAYFVHQTLVLKAGERKIWLMVADVDQSHSDLASLMNTVRDASALRDEIECDIAANQAELMALMAGGDAWQRSSSEETDVHHYANVLFNTLRGGAIVEGYQLNPDDVRVTISRTNKTLAAKHAELLASLPHDLTHPQLVSLAKATGDAQLVRLAYEYLPLTFGRRHGDPSRPWNHYEIKVRDEEGNRLLSYQGNWRDIFQNWEALALSYPNFIASFVAKFVNASTVDGYNPYRITKDGVDWEVLEPEDPWSNIGYWGDHQIIYLLKFLELADKYHSEALIEWLGAEHYSYANVPYEIADVVQLFANPKDTVVFNQAKHDETVKLSQTLGSDGRLLLDSEGAVYQVNLMEKLLVPLLAKLSNFVLDGGIWLNTQRPEWNDANNAIVGNGLSMVTLYYMRRYVAFMQNVLTRAPQAVTLSQEVATWLVQTSDALVRAAQQLKQTSVTGELRKTLLNELAMAAQDYRDQVYVHGFSSKTTVDADALATLLTVSLELLDQTIKSNKRHDGLYNAYNILDVQGEAAYVEELYPMLEGQVALLSAGVLTADESIELLDALFASDMYRADQQTFMLYPDRELSGFLDKNRVAAHFVADSRLMQAMLERDDKRLIQKDVNHIVHFNPEFDNAQVMMAMIAEIKPEYADFSESDWQQLLAAYEATFNHKAFTGRSGTMFGYEGLGCIYWHMVSKLLLAVQENYQASLQAHGMSAQTQALDDFYYRVREGIGFNKTPSVYGAFPTDPYSHTPKQAGAQQPGMTGQVKEEVLTRFGELGVVVNNGVLHIEPTLLKRGGFTAKAGTFVYQDVFGKKGELAMNANSLAFTYCQVPFVYTLNAEASTASMAVTLVSGEVVTHDGCTLSNELSRALFDRKGIIRTVEVVLPASSIKA